MHKHNDPGTFLLTRTSGQKQTHSSLLLLLKDFSRPASIMMELIILGLSTNSKVLANGDYSVWDKSAWACCKSRGQHQPNKRTCSTTSWRSVCYNQRYGDEYGFSYVICSTNYILKCAISFVATLLQLGVCVPSVAAQSVWPSAKQIL